MAKAIIKEIGAQAIGTTDQLLIFFGVEATANLRPFSVIQEFSESVPAIELKKDGWVSFDDQEYQITYVGAFAQEQLNGIGHVTIIFDEAPAEDKLANAIYLTPFEKPFLKEGTIINYH